MGFDDLDNRFVLHPATPTTGPIFDQVRAQCLALAHKLDDLLPESREKSLAITHLEETMFWSNAAIARA